MQACLKVTNIFTIGLLLCLLACGKPLPSKIEFDHKAFELPLRVDQAKEIFGLQYGYYSGFFTGNANDKSIETQLEGFPLFMGSDNDKEESYYGNYFAGITFFKADNTLEQLKAELEKQYNKKIKTETIDFGVTRTLPPFSMTYHYFKTEEGLIVAIKEIVRKQFNKKYTSISFYKGISEKELGKYLEYVN